MSTTPGTPGRRRREREEQYIAFNDNPKKVGTRSGVAMPGSVPRNSGGYEDPNLFFLSSPVAPDTDSRTATYTNRRTPGTGRTMRTSIAPSSTGGPSSAAINRRKRMSDLEGDGPDDTFAQDGDDLVRDDDFAEQNVHATPYFNKRTVTKVPLPSGSRRAGRTPDPLSEAYADLPSPSLNSPTARRSVVARSAQKQITYGRRSKSVSTSPQKASRRLTAALAVQEIEETDELGDAMEIDDILGADLSDDKEDDAASEEEAPTRERAPKKGKGRQGSSVRQERGADDNEDGEEEDDPSHEQGRRATIKSRLSTRSNRSQLADEDNDVTRQSLAPSMQFDADDGADLGDDSFGGDDLGADDYAGRVDDDDGAEDPLDVGIERVDAEEADDDDVDVERQAMEDEDGLDEIPEELDEEDDEPSQTKGKNQNKSKAKTRPPPAKSAAVARGKRAGSVSREKAKPRRQRLSRYENTMDGNGYQGDFQTRRSGRQHIKPLEFWRGEKVEYGKGQHQAVIKEVVTIPRDPVVPLGSKNRHRGGSGHRSKSRARSRSNMDSMPPIEEWDRETDTNGKVVNFVTGQEEDKRIAFPSHMFQPKLVSTADGGRFGYQKCFGDDHQASGFVEIDVNCHKPTKQSKDNQYVFYVIEGAALVSVHRTSFVIAKGGQFLIPRGNDYKIENIAGAGQLRLFFAQSRKVTASEEEERAAGTQPTQATQANESVSQASRVLDSQLSTASAAKGKGRGRPSVKANGTDAAKGKRRLNRDPDEETDDDAASDDQEEEDEEVVPRKKVKGAR